MNTRTKPMVALAASAIVTGCLIHQTAQAQAVLVSYGTSILADVFDTSSGPEALTVSWFVIEDQNSGLYTYSYNVNNPAGDQELNLQGQPNGIAETFNSFQVSFNASLPGAVVDMTTPSNGTVTDSGTAGLAWTFPSVNPGSSSPLLAFQSTLPPSSTAAGVGGGAIPPSPWSSVPAGQPVAAPAPKVVPEPGTTALLVLAAILVWPFRTNLDHLFRNA